MSRILFLRSISILLGCVLSLSANSQPVASDNCETIRDVLAKIHDLRFGDARASLEDSFELDGGLQFAGESVYAFKKCRFIKIDVQFKTGAPEQIDLLPTDKIIKISRPYLEYPFRD
jgi:hypothetical protein